MEKEDVSSLEQACIIQASNDKQDTSAESFNQDPAETTASQCQVTEDKHGGRSGSRQRAKRVRKRPRSDVHSNDNLKIETTVTRLEMDGKPLLEAGGAEQWIRVIHPYPYTFSTFAKQRWVGRTVLDIYVSEFASYPEDYYKAAIRQGLILVSDNKVDPSYKIQGKDVLTHIVHRHEPAVAVYPTKDALTGKPQLVKIIDETEDLIVLDKPGTLPMHPCGGYHLNSLTSMLEGDSLVPTNRKYFNIHRLDRLTSGLVILAKSSAVAKQWSQCIRQRDCKKYYLARVQGRFPLKLEQQHGHNVDRIHASSEPGAVPQDGVWSNVEDPDEHPLDVAKDRNAHGYWITDMSDTTVLGNVSLSDYANTQNCNVDECLAHLDEHNKANGCDNSKAKHSMLWLHLACPTRISKPKDGVCEAGRFDDLEADAYLKTVKPAQTSFAVIKYDAASDSTLVLCRPVTGRTHQIRIHLQYLGHPIANDPNYGGCLFYGNDDGKQACDKARDMLGFDGSDCNYDQAAMDKNTSDSPATQDEIDRLANVVQKEDEPAEEFIERACVWCARCNGRDMVEHNMLEFLVRSRGIWLHALQYCIGQGGNKCKSCSFRTELPSWANL